MDRTASSEWLPVGPLAELEARGVMVVPGADRPIAVFAHQGRVAAVDNRCPHLGFPLHRGSVHDGILTCHWHHARFDLCSGCTFDLYADDVPVFATDVRGGEVFVASRPHGGDALAAGRRRLIEGLEQNLSLIQAKAILTMRDAGADPAAIVREIALFGARHRDGWASGMTILSAMANLAPLVQPETAYLALYQGSRRVAGDCAGQPPRRDRYPLDPPQIPADTLRRWLSGFVQVRHRDGGERTLLTALRAGLDRAAVANILFSAATDRFYADTGHVLDFCAKAFELLDTIGWGHAEQILPTVVGQLVMARGGEEMNAWRHPVDLVPLIRDAEQEMTAALEAAPDDPGTPARLAALAEELLAEEPQRVLSAMVGAIRDGLAPRSAARALAYAAATRIARFSHANEIGDWITALHTFTHCNALHSAVGWSPTPGVVRGLLHGAVSVYLDRFLNVPPAALPGERQPLPDTAETPGALLEAFLAALDQRGDREAAPTAVARYLQSGHPLPPLFDALTHAAVREDADFHTFQMVEASIRQYQAWNGAPQADRILVACARYLAAHSPTQRAQHQTARIALRLHRGDDLHEEDDGGAG